MKAIAWTLFLIFATHAAAAGDCFKPGKQVAARIKAFSAEKTPDAHAKQLCANLKKWGAKKDGEWVLGDSDLTWSKSLIAAIFKLETDELSLTTVDRVSALGLEPIIDGNAEGAVKKYSEDDPDNPYKGSEVVKEVTEITFDKGGRKKGAEIAAPNVRGTYTKDDQKYSFIGELATGKLTVHEVGEDEVTISIPTQWTIDDGKN